MTTQRIGRPTKVTIFDKKPEPGREAFEQGVPLSPEQENSRRAIILFEPNLQHIGSIDNTDSPASTTYAKSVTSGFTFTMSQGIDYTISLEASVDVVKVNESVSFNLTFTEQWSKSTTETFEFSVPAGKKAFTYQGYILAATMENTGTNDYHWVSGGEQGRFLTNVLRTTSIPLMGIQ